jgi:hypothetical protein
MHEDDWRQVEFVLNSDRATVDRELGELEKFKVEKRSGVGWTDVYVRKSRRNSIEPGAIPLTKILEILGSNQVRSLYLGATGDTPVKVLGGFAINVEGMIVYGHKRADDRVASLGLVPGAPTSLSVPQRKKLAALCRALNAFLVDWYSVSIVSL